MGKQFMCKMAPSIELSALSYNLTKLNFYSSLHSPLIVFSFTLQESKAHLSHLRKNLLETLNFHTFIHTHSTYISTCSRYFISRRFRQNWARVCCFHPYGLKNKIWITWKRNALPYLVYGCNMQLFAGTYHFSNSSINRHMFSKPCKHVL